MPSIPLFPPHHDPHAAPLCHIERLNDPGHLVDECDCAGDVVQHGDVAHLLPWHGHVLQQLEDGVGDVLERPQINALVVLVLFGRHVAVISDDLAQVLAGHVFLLDLHKAKLLLVSVLFAVDGAPLSRLFGQVVVVHLGEENRLKLNFKQMTLDNIR